MYYTYVMIIPTILLFVCFLARPSLLHFSLSKYFLYFNITTQPTLSLFAIHILLLYNILCNTQSVTLIYFITLLIRYGHLDIVKFLVNEAHCKADAVDEYRSTPLHYAAR